jgi:stage V sporulation protein AE
MPKGVTEMETIMPYLRAFIVGGLICCIGQALIMNTKLTNARILVIFVVSGVALTALGLYKPLVDFAGAGATVPLTGFGYSLAMGAIEAVNKYGLIGAFVGGVTRTAAGITAAVVFGLLNALVFKPHAKP